MKIQLFDFKIMGDDRGSLIALESKMNIPFEIKRVYYIFATLENVRRGYHAHKKLQQVLICTSGSCKVHLDDGRTTTEIVLDSPSTGLFLDTMIWREMYDFSLDCVLTVLASDYFNESDYIRDYEQFVEGCTL